MSLEELGLLSLEAVRDCRSGSPHKGQWGEAAASNCLIERVALNPTLHTSEGFRRRLGKQAAGQSVLLSHLLRIFDFFYGKRTKLWQICVDIHCWCVTLRAWMKLCCLRHSMAASCSLLVCLCETNKKQKVRSIDSLAPAVPSMPSMPSLPSQQCLLYTIRYYYWYSFNSLHCLFTGNHIYY